MLAGEMGDSHGAPQPSRRQSGFSAVGEEGRMGEEGRTRVQIKRFPSRLSLH